MPGAAGFATSNVPGARSAAASTGTQPPPNSRKMPTKIAIVTPNLRRKLAKPFFATGS
jgi:hypothetical protein